MNIFHDIETVPSQDKAVVAALRDEMEAEILAIKAPGNYKDPTKIAEYVKAEAEKVRDGFQERYRKTALNGLRGEVLCVAWALDDNDVVGMVRSLEAQEAPFLDDVFRRIKDARHTGSGLLERDCWVGHNCREFDLRFLYHRAVILGVNPGIRLPHNARPGSGEVYDTMTEWAGWGNRIALDAIRKALGLPGKDASGMDGSQVYDAALAGRSEDILRYCMDDVEGVRSVYRRMNFQS